MSRSKPPDDFRPGESPIAWFGEMLIAIARGDFERASNSQRRLDRLASARSFRWVMWPG
jgi:hypothetical protein